MPDERGRSGKRVLDVVVAAVLVLLTAPVLLVAAGAVLVSSPGPVLFRHTRLGLGGRPFEALKLRTMHVGAEERLVSMLARDPRAAAEFERFACLRDDPRVAGPVGRFLRRWSIDELPQLWNVLRGDMSCVGPRPLAVEVHALLDDEHRRLRGQVRPGLTGPYQVAGRCDVDLATMRDLDLAYVTRWGVGGDLAILVRTLRAVVGGAGAR